MSRYAQGLDSLEHQKLALQKSLAAHLTSPAGEALEGEAESFTEAVFAQTRPAIVLLDAQARDYHRACHLGERGGASVALIVNVLELQNAHLAYGAFGPLVVPDLSSFSQGFIGASLDYDGDGDYDEKAFFLPMYRDLPPSLARADYARLTAPPVEELFPEVGRRSLKDEYYWSRVKAYEAWLYPLNYDRRRDGVLQLGGWPEFVQDGDSNTFIAQANLGVGDAGGLYVHLEGGELTADIQMY